MDQDKFFKVPCPRTARTYSIQHEVSEEDFHLDFTNHDVTTVHSTEPQSTVSIANTVWYSDKTLFAYVGIWVFVHV